MSKRKKRRTPRPRLRSVARSVDFGPLLDELEAAFLKRDEEAIARCLEPLWDAPAKGAEALAHRLCSGRSRAPLFDFELLIGLAGDDAPTLLRRIADDRDAPDIVRFGAQRRAGWPVGYEPAERIKFLESLRDGDATLVGSTDGATSFWPPLGDILQEVVEYLAVLTPERRLLVVERIIDQVGHRSAWLLRALLHLDDPPLSRRVVAELARLRDPASTGALHRLARLTRDPELRTEAEAAARRLRLQLVDRPGGPTSPDLPAIERAILSVVDNDGGQIVLVVRSWEPGAILIANIFHDDTRGVCTVFGTSRGPDEMLDAMLDDLEDSGVQMIDVDLAAVRGALARAIEVNAARGEPLPPLFEIWEPLMHDAYPARDDEPVVIPELDDAPFAGRADLVKSSRRLADHPLFDLWTFDGERTRTAMFSIAPPTTTRWTDRQYGPLIGYVLDASTRELMRQRLRRQAWLLDHVGERAARDQALAVAARLARDDPTLHKIPFLRALIERSVADVVASVFEELGSTAE